MKTFLLLLIIFLCEPAYAQLPEGAIAPDFTFTDINGISRNLYTYLDSGMYVALDISATWCVPCWEYHRSGVMDSLYELHDNPGDKKWKIFFIEGDGGTDLADLQGSGTHTQGNWLTGAHFPFIDPPSGIGLNDFKVGFSISFFPTLYLICPDKRIHKDVLNSGYKPSVATWEYVAHSNCSLLEVEEPKENNSSRVYPNPCVNYSTINFSMASGAGVQLTISDVIGRFVTSKDYGYLNAGVHDLKIEVNNLKPGIYFLTLSESNGALTRAKIVVQ